MKTSNHQQFVTGLFVGALLNLAPVKAEMKTSASDDFSIPPVASPFTGYLNELKQKFSSQTWRKIQDEAGKKQDDLKITCYSDDKSKTAIGMRQSVLIRAPLERVKAIMEDINSYAELFPDLAEVKVLEKRGIKWLTSWEQAVPFPFSNIHYRMLYEIESTANSVVLRYQLTHSKTLIYSDGLIILTADESHPDQTRYFEIDFWDADYGIGASLAPDSIRNASVEGVYISDKAVQFKAENPSLTHKQALKEAKKSLNKKAVEACIQNRKPFQVFWN